MDALGWVVAIIILLLFGRGSSGFGFTVSGGTSPLFTNPNQDTTDTPANQPAPWGNGGCNFPQPVARTNQPYVSPLASGFVSGSPVSQSLPMAPAAVSRVTFSQSA